VAFRAEDASPDALDDALTWCLTDAARTEAQRCSERARRMLEKLGGEFKAEAALDSAGRAQRVGAIVGG